MSQKLISTQYEESLLQIEKLLKINAIPEIVAVTERLQQQNLLSTNLANLLFDNVRNWHSIGYFQEQIRIYELIGKYLPEGWKILQGVGYAAQMHGNNEKAEYYYNQALALNPDYPFSKLALGQLQMMNTCFAKGRELYEARFTAHDNTDAIDWRELPIPRWRGESITGKNLYLWVEQGVGDVIMFAGILPHLLAQEPKNITIGMVTKLIPILARSFPEITVEHVDNSINRAIAPMMADTLNDIMKMLNSMSLQDSLAPLQKTYTDMPNPAIDYAAPLGDLLVYSIPEFIPAKHQESYLVADEKRVSEIKEKLLQYGTGRKIGISWYTSNTKDGMVRNIPLELWEQVFNVPGCLFFSLQHHIDPKEIEDFCARTGHKIIISNLDFVDDIEGLAATIACMDEVITIDNSNVHLAGSLGIPTTLLLPIACNFRWPTAGIDAGSTIWYKNVHIERQIEIGNWLTVINHTAQSLRTRL